jgi:hypothetical protein
MDSDKKNRASLWEDAINTELKQPTDYQTFGVMDSGEAIPNDNRKIPYHLVFDVKYELRYKSKLVAGVNWTVNERQAKAANILRFSYVKSEENVSDILTNL